MRDSSLAFAHFDLQKQRYICFGEVSAPALTCVSIELLHNYMRKEAKYFHMPTKYPCNADALYQIEFLKFLLFGVLEPISIDLP